MKKAYVKVKPKSVKKSWGALYIAAAVFGAVLCAVVFSFVLKPSDDLKDDIKIDISEVTPEEIAQVSEPIEITVPKEPEIKNEPIEEVKEPKTDVVEPKPEEVEQVGIFGADVRFSFPVKGEIVNDYSGSKPVKSKTTGEWRVHSGIDIKAPSGSGVCCPADGVVIVCEDNKLTGKTVSIDHGNGHVSTVYNLQSINVESGQKIKEGEIIGTVGNTAVQEMKEEPHVHFEIKKNGKFINPKDVLK